jgi:hypothetical protein
MFISTVFSEKKLFTNTKNDSVNNFFRKILHSFRVYNFISIIAQLPFWICYTGFLILIAIGIMAFFNIDYTVDTINQKSEYIRLIKIQEKFINLEDSDEELDVFKLQLRSDKVLYEQPFELMKYYRDDWEFKMEDFEKLSSICDDFNGFNTRIPFSFFEEYIIEKYSDHSETWQAMMIIRALIAHLATRVNKVYIFIKGYSDTTPNESWIMQLNPKYHYNQIEYYKADNPLYTSYVIDNDNLKKITVPQKNNLSEGSYSNEDLPFLRAKFVLENYIIDFLQNCTEVEFDAGILEGEVIGKHDKIMRNVEVYIVVKRNMFNRLVN